MELSDYMLSSPIEDSLPMSAAISTGTGAVAHLDGGSPFDQPYAVALSETNIMPPQNVDRQGTGLTSRHAAGTSKAYVHAKYTCQLCIHCMKTMTFWKTCLITCFMHAGNKHAMVC